MIFSKHLSAILLGAAAFAISGCSTTKTGGEKLFTVSELAAGSQRKVMVSPSTEGGGSLRVTLVPGLAQAEMGDKPTYVRIPAKLKNGVIEVDVMARTLPDAPPHARGFAGLAYHIDPAADRFEGVYLRPTNGAGLNPPAPRDKRAVQWFSFPDWPFDRLRETFPSNPYEVGAHIAPDRWIKLRLEIRGHQVVAFVDGRKAIEVESRVAPVEGSVGLWVDIGTEAFFKDLRVKPEI